MNIEAKRKTRLYLEEFHKTSNITGLDITSARPITIGGG